MNWKDYISEAERINEESGMSLDEKLVKKVRERRNDANVPVKEIVWVTDKVNTHVEYDENGNPREVIDTGMYKQKKRQAARKAQRKRNAKMKQSQKLRVKTFKDRAKKGIEYNKKVPQLNRRREEGQDLKSDLKGALKAKLDRIKNGLKNVMNSLHK
jgi:hypothetical protein